MGWRKLEWHTKDPGQAPGGVEWHTQRCCPIQWARACIARCSTWPGSSQKSVTGAAPPLNQAEDDAHCLEVQVLAADACVGCEIHTGRQLLREKRVRMQQQLTPARRGMRNLSIRRPPNAHAPVTPHTAAAPAAYPAGRKAHQSAACWRRLRPSSSWPQCPAPAPQSAPAQTGRRCESEGWHGWSLGAREGGQTAADLPGQTGATM